MLLQPFEEDVAAVLILSFRCGLDFSVVGVVLGLFWCMNWSVGGLGLGISNEFSSEFICWLFLTMHRFYLMF